MKRIICKITIYLFYILGGSAIVEIFLTSTPEGFYLYNSDLINPLFFLLPPVICLVAIYGFLTNYQMKEIWSKFFLLAIIIVVINGLTERTLKREKLYSYINFPYSIVLEYEDENWLESSSVHSSNCELVEKLIRNDRNLKKGEQSWHLEKFYFSWRTALNSGRGHVTISDHCLSNIEHSTILFMDYIDILEYETRLLFARFYKTIVLSGPILILILWLIEVTLAKEDQKVISDNTIELMSKSYRTVLPPLLFVVVLFYLGSIS